MSAPPSLPARRVLLIHFGQMGDAVLALPAAQAVRRAYSAAAVTVLAGRSGAEIFRLAGFQPVWAVDRAAWRNSPPRAARELLVLLARLRRARFDLSVDLHAYKETNLLAWAAGIRVRVAMLRPTRSWPRLITHKPPPDQARDHLLDRYCRVLAPLGISVMDRRPQLVAAPEDAAWAAAEMPDAKEYLGICPGAGHPSRRWPAANFAAAARQLARQLAAPPRIAVFAGPEETEAQLAPLRELAGARVYSRLSVSRLAAALARCRVVAGNASGPSHIAAATGTVVITIGEIPMFDPPGRVIPVRAERVVSDVSVAAVAEALSRGWQWSAGDQSPVSARPLKGEGLG
ncbi:MAG: glycosyltransferase family 9 protein [Terriglobales bacterium]